MMKEYLSPENFNHRDDVVFHTFKKNEVQKAGNNTLNENK